MASLQLSMAGMQTVFAQKVIIVTNVDEVITYNLQDLKCIMFEEANPDEHEWVDLGFPSGTLWATCNVGANSPEEYGDYFSWGETEPKDEYNWSTYRYCKGSQMTITKYCTSSDYGYNGFTDGLTELLPEDDAATANWGEEWQMPSIRQFGELRSTDYTTTTWTTQNGVYGRLITSKINGNSIFLPAAGYRDGTGLYYTDSRGFYWSRTLELSYSSCGVGFTSENIGWYYDHRDHGQSVRPVRKK